MFVRFLESGIMFLNKIFFLVPTIQTLFWDILINMTYIRTINAFFLKKKIRQYLLDFLKNKKILRKFKINVCLIIFKLIFFCQSLFMQRFVFFSVQELLGMEIPLKKKKISACFLQKWLEMLEINKPSICCCFVYIKHLIKV